ncbi:MAG: helix-hairpin-helix domain-containing protein [Chloroflexi bacterium]|nr:helix-hairpin-helix domain-containing protein [Chloroflexota bacterium]
METRRQPTPPQGSPRQSEVPTQVWERLAQLALLLLFLFAMAGGIALLVRQSMPKGIEVILPPPTPPSSRSEAAPRASDGTGSQAQEYRLNINMAVVEELVSLPGIGEVKAKAILDYRQQYGPFERVEDLLKVPGIGPATLEKIRDLIAVE